MCTQNENTKTIHPLFAREVRPIYNWHEWLERWKGARGFQEFDSLIHCGFCVPIEKSKFSEQEYTEIDRIKFYLGIADGWMDNQFFKLSGDGKDRYFVDRDSIIKNSGKTLGELRQLLARKAFDKLCLNFFTTKLMSNDGDGFFNSSWKMQITSEQLFPAILNFFAAEKSTFDSIRIRNIFSYGNERSHNEELAVNFLLNLARFIFGWRERKIWDGMERELREEMEAENVTVRSRLDSAKPWMIEVLSYLNHLVLLRKWILELDGPCLAKLKEIALRSELSYYQHPVKGNRSVASTEEACLAGSPAALLLNEYELKMGVYNRLTAILEAEQQKEDALREAEEKSRS